MPDPGRYRRVIMNSGTAGYVFSSSQAKTYWDALTAANGGVEVNGSVYSISTLALKMAINAFFVTGTADGWLSNMIGMYPYIGGTAATHAINAINPGTFNLTFINSPTQGVNGFGPCDGTTQYATTGIIASTHLTANNVHVSYYNGSGSVSSTKAGIGAQVSATQRILVDYLVGLYNVFDCYSSTAGTGRAQGTTNNPLGWLCGDRISNVRSDIYYNGVSDGNSTSVAGTQPNIEFYLGASNSAGTPIAFANWRFEFHSVGSSLGSTKVTSLNTAITTLKAALGR